jgi:hypothetical protein
MDWEEYSHAATGAAEKAGQMLRKNIGKSIKVIPPSST